MQKFENDDFSFSVPDKWIERTVVMWSAPAVLGKIPPNFAISYDIVKDGDDLLTYANKQIDSLRGALKDWQLVQQFSRKIGGKEALTAQFSWALPTVRMMQKQSFILLGKGRAISVGCTAPANDFPVVESTYFDVIEGSLQF